MRTIALLALFVAVVAAGDLRKPKCPMAPGKYPFDAEKFSGEWNLVAGCSSSLESKGKCGKYNVVYQKDNKDVAMTTRYTGVSTKDSTPITFEALTSAVISDKAAFGYSVSRHEGSNSYSEVYKQSIIATDYNTYALYVACRPVFDAQNKNFDRKIYAEIWARQGVTLSKDTLDTLTSVLASYDIDTTDIKTVEC